MKLLPEAPTPTMMAEYAKCGLHLHRDGYAAMYAAAPEVNDEPVAWALYWNPDDMCRITMNEGDAINWLQDAINFDGSPAVIPPYAHPSPRIAELEAEIARLKKTFENTVGSWLSAALDDPKVCSEMKADINKMFEALK